MEKCADCDSYYNDDELFNGFCYECLTKQYGEDVVEIVKYIKEKDDLELDSGNCDGCSYFHYGNELTEIPNKDYPSCPDKFCDECLTKKFGRGAVNLIKNGIVQRTEELEIEAQEEDDDDEEEEVQTETWPNKRQQAYINRMWSF